jgi:hypothetical protein
MDKNIGDWRSPGQMPVHDRELRRLLCDWAMLILTIIDTLPLAPRHPRLHVPVEAVHPSPLLLITYPQNLDLETDGTATFLSVKSQGKSSIVAVILLGLSQFLCKSSVCVIY